MVKIFVHMGYNFVYLFIISIFFLLYILFNHSSLFFFFLSFCLVYSYDKIRNIVAADYVELLLTTTWFSFVVVFRYSIIVVKKEYLFGSCLNINVVFLPVPLSLSAFVLAFEQSSVGVLVIQYNDSH